MRPYKCPLFHDHMPNEIIEIYFNPTRVDLFIEHLIEYHQNRDNQLISCENNTFCIPKNTMPCKDTVIVYSKSCNAVIFIDVEKITGPTAYYSISCKQASDGPLAVHLLIEYSGVNISWRNNIVNCRNVAHKNQMTYICTIRHDKITDIAITGTIHRDT